MTIFWGLFFLLLFLIGLYLIALGPLSKKYESSIYLDYGVGAFLVVVALLYIILTHIVPNYDDRDGTEPCGFKSPQAICYGLDSRTCSEAWHSFDAACDEELRPIREKRPSALLYQVSYKCHARKFDKITFYNRRKSDTAFCQEYFKKID